MTAGDSGREGPTTARPTTQITSSHNETTTISTDGGRPTAAAVASAKLASSASPLNPSASSASPPSPRATETWSEAFRQLSPRDLNTLHTKPCVRESVLTGMGAGFGMGGLRLILTSGAAGPWQLRQYRAMSWAVGTFVLVSCASHAFCQRRRLLERQAMLRATAIVEEKRRVMRDEADSARELRRLALEKEEREGGLWKWVGWR